MTCEYCNSAKTSSIAIVYREEFGEYLCHRCYVHYREHPINPIPEPGIIAYDDEGRVICHICGRAYDKLSTHLRYKHGVSKDSYKEEFGLNRTQKLTSESHAKKVRDAVGPTLTNVDKHRRDVWNEGHRRGKKLRLQAILNRNKEIVK